MFNRFNFSHLLILASALFTLAQANAAPGNNTNIEASLVDAGDYYLDKSGNAIRFYRKQDTFLILDSIDAARQNKANNNGAPALAKKAARDASLNDASLKRVQHKWGALDIVKKQGARAKKSASALNNITNNTANNFAPVFATANGHETLILPDIMVSFKTELDARQFKHALLKQFDLKVKNQMMFSETDFVLAFKTPVDDFSQVFTVTRDIMALPYIDWAEPNMLVQLEKTAEPDPNDVLYRDQWGLFNWSQNGEYCDANTNIAADIDANDAWDLMKSLGITTKPVIAIIDDGVDLSHSDLPIWTNPSPSSGIPFAGGNSCEDDIHGCNFGSFYVNTNRFYNHSDSATTVPPDPQTSDDIHGTRVAGIAAAKRNNVIGIAGSAYDAQILPIRLDFSNLGTDCVAIADALYYAAKYADVISNSWSEPSGACTTLINTRLGTITAGDAAFKRGTKGTPVLFASGNSAAGWRKISMTLPSAGTLRFTLHKNFFTLSGENAVWLDNIQLPGSSVQTIGAGFPSASWKISGNGNNTKNGAGNFTACSTTTSATQPVAAAGNHTIEGTGHSIKLAANAEKCQYLEISSVNAGNLTFWMWASVDSWDTEFFDGDLFQVYLNGSKIDGSLNPRGTTTRGINTFDAIEHNTLAYPASHTQVIAVGASNDGSDGQEDRAYFSQYGSTLDILAPGTAIRSTANNNSYSYVSGTSAATPLVAGAIANMLAIDPSLTLAEIKTKLQDGADKIGPDSGEFAYSAGFNKFYGYGRLNAYKSAQLANGVMAPLEANESCEDPNPGAADDGFLLLIIPSIISGALKNK